MYQILKYMTRHWKQEHKKATSENRLGSFSLVIVLSMIIYQGHKSFSVPVKREELTDRVKSLEPYGLSVKGLLSD